MKSSLKKILSISGSIIGVCSVTAAIAATIIVIQKNNNYDNTVLYNSANNSQEEYINDNSLSLLFYIQANSTYYSNLLNKLSENKNNKNYLSLINYISDNKNTSLYNISSGTTWLFDYKIGVGANQYYFATNIHVLDLGYTVEYEINSSESINFFVPYNSVNSGTLNTFITQPNGQMNSNSYNEFKTIESNTINSLINNWVNLNNYYRSIIPLGVIYGQNIPDTNPYLGKITYSSNNNEIIFYIDDQYNMYKSFEYESSNIKGNDFGLIEFEIDPDNLNTSNFSKVNPYILNCVKNIFLIPTSINENIKERSYIQKIQYLNSLISDYENNLEEINNNFIFTSFNNDTNIKYSIAGYPGVSLSNGTSYVTFNCFTIESNSVERNNYLDSRTNIEVWYNSQNYYYQYDSYNNYKFQNLNLGHGSSGSMVINQDYQLIGIYWGVIESDEWLYGMVTPLYDINNSNSLVFRWLSYLKYKGNQTELYNLFYKLNSKNFFKK